MEASQKRGKLSHTPGIVANGEIWPLRFPPSTHFELHKPFPSVPVLCAKPA